MINQYPLPKRQNQEITFNTDERKRVKGATKPPFRWICSLEVEFPEPVIYPLGTLETLGQNWSGLQPTKRGCGSGLLITSKHVLTAAHVIAGLKLVRDSKTGKNKFQLVTAKKVIVTPARNDYPGTNPKPFSSFSSYRVRINPEFKMGMELNITAMTKKHIRNMLPHDFGVVELLPQQERKRLSFRASDNLIGSWSKEPENFITPVETTFHRQLQRTKINIAGYPGEKNTIPCSTLWWSYDWVIKTFPKFNGRPLDLILYQADTSAGMSGSPVWIKCHNGKRYLIGIHSSFFKYSEKKTGQRTTANVAALITRKLISQLQTWRISV